MQRTTHNLHRRMPAALIATAALIALVPLAIVLAWLWREWAALDLVLPWLTIALRALLFGALSAAPALILWAAWRRYADHRYIQAGYVTQLTLARRSQGLPATVQSLSWHDSHRSETMAQLPALTDTPPALLPEPPLTLRAAIDRGASTPERWLIGMDADGTAQQIALKHAGFVALAGVQGTGKTNAAAWLAAQCAAHGGTLFIADPQYGDEQSLSTRIAPFSGAVARFAVTPDEINELVAKVDAIYTYRNRNPGLYPPVLLLIDEFMDLMLRKSLSDATLTALLGLSSTARKKNIFVSPIAANWNLRALGAYGVAIRQNVTHALVFRSSKETAELLLPSAYADRARMIEPGQTLFFGGGEPKVTTVPWLTSDDMQLAARGRAPNTYAPVGVPSRVVTSGLPPTARVTPIPVHAAPPTMPMVITVPEQILDLLTARGAWMTASEIASALRIDLMVVRVELVDLSDACKLAKRRCQGRTTKERFEYGRLTNLHISGPLVVSA